MVNLQRTTEVGSFRRIAVILMAIVAAVIMSGTSALDASAAAAKMTAPKLVAEKTYGSGDTHPYKKQTSTLKVNWKSVSGAKKYDVYIMGGQYKTWTKYKTVTTTSCTVTGLKRTTEYKFKVRAVSGNTYSAFSSVQTLKTARMDYDQAGWEAMCRIVYHEVGQINNSMWDKPIVYVADCVANQYVAAKYTNNKTWAPYYRKYTSVQQVIYNSGGFMSSAALTRDGATYSKVPSKVKLAVWGAVYGKTTYKGIKNDYNVYFWCNRSYKTNSSKIAYSFKIPWGYFNVWRSYWG